MLIVEQRPVTGQLADCQLADWTTRSWTGQLADWTTRGLADAAKRTKTKRSKSLVTSASWGPYKPRTGQTGRTRLV